MDRSEKRARNKAAWRKLRLAEERGLLDPETDTTITLRKAKSNPFNLWLHQKEPTQKQLLEKYGAGNWYPQPAEYVDPATLPITETNWPRVPASWPEVLQTSGAILPLTWTDQNVRNVALAVKSAVRAVQTDPSLGTWEFLPEATAENARNAVQSLLRLGSNAAAQTVWMMAAQHFGVRPKDGVPFDALRDWAWSVNPYGAGF